VALLWGSNHKPSKIPSPQLKSIQQRIVTR